MSGQPQFKYVACDASFDPTTGVAALAACVPGSPLAGAIQRCANADEAERAAILLAMSAAASRQMRVVEFRCDASGAVDRILNHRDPDMLTRRIRGHLKRPPRQGTWRLEVVHRSDVHAAHKLAEFMWKAFVAGKAVVTQGIPVPIGPHLTEAGKR